ncbi:Gar1/Naf1 RNA binding region-domain-containing protein [Lentinula lateritia]|uniref:H/ACA ribonucleoprotein complex subunit n=1 Tax=Lentinula lateritia TaxID=40482 RepID=A0ABQ8VZ92_9AGAR|nr:Gar1/Naf1 RNA binding region-domain-containing protein [Lentinula lateritia]
MSRGGSRGFSRGRGGGRGGFQQRDFGPPDTVLEMGSFVHAVESEMLCSSTIADKVPYFNAPIYLQNKSVIGKVDEILGPINEVYFSIKMSEGVIASSFQKGDKVYIGGDKLLPIERFLPKPKVAGERGRGGARGAPGGRGRGAPRGGARGGRGGGGRGFGGDRGGRGFSRGGGGNFSRGRSGFRGGGGGRGGFRGS